eukprot:5757579-Pyramimonas_sp.AAC.1
MLTRCIRCIFEGIFGILNADRRYVAMFTLRRRCSIYIKLLLKSKRMMGNPIRHGHRKLIMSTACDRNWTGIGEPSALNGGPLRLNAYLRVSDDTLAVNCSGK